MFRSTSSIRIIDSFERNGDGEVPRGQLEESTIYPSTSSHDVPSLPCLKDIFLRKDVRT